MSLLNVKQTNTSSIRSIGAQEDTPDRPISDLCNKVAASIDGLPTFQQIQSCRESVVKRRVVMVNVSIKMRDAFLNPGAIVTLISTKCYQSLWALCDHSF